MYYVPDRVLDAILEEDLPYGDETMRLVGVEALRGRVVASNKAAGTVSGISLAARLMRHLGLCAEELANDGVSLPAGSPLLSATGSAEALHAVYKTAQVIMEYCTGISTRTRTMVDAAQAVNPHCQVALTRKHFPGTKVLSLYAATMGGGIIHRTGLSESILVFDQHRILMDDPIARIRAVRDRSPERMIAVEVNSPEEGLAFAAAGANVIQCEKFTPEVLAQFVPTLKAQFPAVRVVAAGGVRGDNAAQYAATGVDALVTTWPYFAPPSDIKMRFTRDDTRDDACTDE